MSIFADITAPYWLAFKAIILAVVVVGASVYVVKTEYHISGLKSDVIRLKNVLSSCQQHAKDLTQVNQFQANSINELHAYYQNRKCLDLRDGELSDSELELK